MSRDWEQEFRKWATSPSETEQKRCENAISAIKNAITKSEALKHRRTRVFVQGSYRNRVNVRKESDVDVGVLCDETFFPQYPAGKSGETCLALRLNSRMSHWAMRRCSIRLHAV